MERYTLTVEQAKALAIVSEEEQEVYALLDYLAKNKHRFTENEILELMDIESLDRNGQVIETTIVSSKKR